MLLPNLRYYRTLAGYTQHELAQKAGMNRVTASNLENGRYHVVTHTLKKLAEALDVEPTELLED